jgi:hypothetical protein
MPINPRDNSISVGLDAIQKNREATFQLSVGIETRNADSIDYCAGAAMVGAVFIQPLTRLPS